MSLGHAGPDRHRFSLADRFQFGKFTIAEICALARRSKTLVYRDIAEGRLTVEKYGRSTRVAGPEARRYLGAGITQNAA
jgi:hypothetical protein